MMLSSEIFLRYWDLWVNTLDKFLSRLDYIQTDKINPGKDSLTLAHLNISFDALQAIQQRCKLIKRFILPGTILLKFIFSIRIYGVWSVRMSRWQVLFVTILLTITLALFWLKLFTLEWLSHQSKIRVLFSFFFKLFNFL